MLDRLRGVLQLERKALALAARAAAFPVSALASRAERLRLWRLAEVLSGASDDDLYPRVRLSDLMDEVTPVQVANLPARAYNVSEAELLALAALASRLRPRTAFEIGTADGRTTRNLALNVAEDGTLWTLNLPLDEDPGHSQEVPVGARFRDTPEAARITQLWGNSATFDFAPYRGRCELVFIDADHSEAGVLIDSRHALDLVDRRRGVVLWHDATRYGVRVALPGLAREQGLPIHRIADTSLALLAFADGRAVVPTDWAARLDPVATAARAGG